jgi:lysine decarboxylase
VLDVELVGAQASHDLDRVPKLIDASNAGATGYQTADWLARTLPHRRRPCPITAAS